ncbi:MAG: sucrase ferredoxin [Streptosporangiaceae bacterium]
MAQVKGCAHGSGSHAGLRPCLASATARPRAWLLLEHPGPWPERIEWLGLPIIAEAERHGVRTQLIRRTGRRRAAHPIQMYAGWSGPGPWLEGRVLEDPAELAELDLAAVARGLRPGFGTPVDHPLFLLCTHGKRNVCCATTGAPLARQLAGRFPETVWETSHVGGDRFAANLVCLPHGLYYGELDAAHADAAVRAYLRGEVVLDRFRGRAGLPEPAQAAEHFVRQRTGLLGVDEVTVESVTGSGPFTALVSAGGSRWSGTVEPIEFPASSGGVCDDTVQTYQIRDLALHSEAALV